MILWSTKRTELKNSMKLKVIPAMGKPAKAGDMSAVILKVFYFQKKKKKIQKEIKSSSDKIHF